MRNPLVSICVPTYNRVAALRDCLKNISQQDYEPLEILISDNCSDDGTQQVCEEVAARDLRIRYVRQPQNIGLYGNHNFCVESSRGEYLCFFHDHDEHDARQVSEYVSFFREHPEVGVVCSDWELIDESGQCIGIRDYNVGLVTPGLSFIDQTIRCGRCSVATPGAMVRRSALDDTRFDERGPIGFGDFPVWFRVAEEVLVGHIHKRLWRCRQLAQSQSTHTIESMARDYDENLMRYCEGHLARWPQHARLVARWRRYIRRYLFWALAFEVGLYFRQQPQEPSGRGRRAQTIFELLPYRLSPEAFRHALEQLRSYRTGSMEHATCFVMEILMRLRYTRPLTWATYHVPMFRRLMRLQ